MPAIDQYLTQVLERDGSDLHFLAGDPARVRQYGELQALAPEPLAAETVKTTLYEIMPKLAVERFESKDGTDFAYAIPGVARFRVNVMRQLNGMGAVFRAIPSKARTAEELKLPKAVMDLCKINSGLILVTGKTGSGKSTTLAAMIDDINSREKGHILTIEDPIEFVHLRKNCLISQREIGVHAATFSSALLSALREDPDVILVGELRDLETMSIAVTAAEMGILVMAHAAHQRRRGHRRSIGECISGRQTAACTHHAVDQPARRRLAAAHSEGRQEGPRCGAGDSDQYPGGRRI